MARRPQSVAAPCHGCRDTGGPGTVQQPRNGVPLSPPRDTVAILTSGGPAQASCPQLRAHPAGARTHGATGELASGQPHVGTGCPNTPTPACTGTSRHCLILRPPGRDPSPSRSPSPAAGTQGHPLPGAFPRPSPWLRGPFPITHAFLSQAPAGETCPKSRLILIAHPGPRSHILTHPGCCH